jgi:hypothetical protein
LLLISPQGGEKAMKRFSFIALLAVLLLGFSVSNNKSTAYAVDDIIPLNMLSPHEEMSLHT